jgi:hypothetical protein
MPLEKCSAVLLSAEPPKNASTNSRYPHKKMKEAKDGYAREVTGGKCEKLIKRSELPAKRRWKELILRYINLILSI